MATTPRTEKPAETVAVEYWNYSDIELVRVVDGDTVWLRVHVDIGFRVKATAEIEIRLDGLNCPEKNTPEGIEALTFTASWLVRNQGSVQLSTRKAPEKYGRWLGTLRAGQECLNDLLISKGYAVPYHGERRT